ncbi:hypothetical protein GS506_19280 [Rhodococcus hoagii]|nr:hypothetical protein [Prescottella equi]
MSLGHTRSSAISPRFDSTSSQVWTRSRGSVPGLDASGSGHLGQLGSRAGVPPVR